MKPTGQKWTWAENEEERQLELGSEEGTRMPRRLTKADVALIAVAETSKKRTTVEGAFALVMCSKQQAGG